MDLTQKGGREQACQPGSDQPAAQRSDNGTADPAMKSRRAMHRARQRLTHMRLEVAKAQVTLEGLQAAIRVARSDPGIAALHGMRVRNEHLTAANSLAAQDALTTRSALDAAVKASQTDPLTGLSNRTVLWDRLSHEIEVARRQGHRVAVCLLDVDNFKTFNDRFGHQSGDLVLQRVASVLSAALRSSDTICRIGGDEFVVVAPAMTPRDAALLASKIEQGLRESLPLAGHAIGLSASFGFSVYPEDGDTAQALVQRADEAMYRMKASRGSPMTRKSLPRPEK